MHLESFQSPSSKNLLSTEIYITERQSRFECDYKGTTIGVAGTVSITGTPTKNNALLSFELSGLDGEPLTEEEIRELKASGIMKSDIPSIGFYRYLHTEEGEYSFNHSVQLPATVTCQGVSIRKFRESKSELKLKRFSIYDTACPS